MDKWDELKNTIAVMSEYVYNGFMFPRDTFHKFLSIRKQIMENDDNKNFDDYCPTCGSCGENECCPPSRCKFGVSYINELREEIVATRKALGAYIQMMGFQVTEEMIDKEIEFYGRD